MGVLRKPKEQMPSLTQITSLWLHSPTLREVPPTLIIFVLLTLYSINPLQENISLSTLNFFPSANLKKSMRKWNLKNQSETCPSPCIPTLSTEQHLPPQQVKGKLPCLPYLRKVAMQSSLQTRPKDGYIWQVNIAVQPNLTIHQYPDAKRERIERFPYSARTLEKSVSVSSFATRVEILGKGMCRLHWPQFSIKLSISTPKRGKRYFLWDQNER